MSEEQNFKTMLINKCQFWMILVLIVICGYALFIINDVTRPNVIREIVDTAVGVVANGE